MFLVLAAPGQGKSRCLQELPAFISATQAIGQRRMLSFLLTLENGQSPDTSLKTSPACIVASRMLWQLLQEKRKEAWGGLSAGFSFDDLRRAVAESSSSIDDVLRAVLVGEGEQDYSAWCVVLVLDGMQSLHGSDTPQNKGSLFYQTLRKVCVLINRLEGPLVLGAVAATVHFRSCKMESGQLRGAEERST